ncbi:MAG: hypothetical protein CM15mP59_1430 [Flavobacteriaceae bacterium]|nr:MAG: hypothetical protein CM15mP59_1430 [Flavobacteriaceae bacterium]
MNADSYGFIFVFQILPTIVFFASLTSLLFYLGCHTSCCEVPRFGLDQSTQDFWG